jgi:hypothetical protein
MDVAQQIDSWIAGLPDWQRSLATELRAIVHEADPEIVEEWKWSTPVFSHGGQVCAIGAFKDHVKMNFFKGATLADPRGLYNAGLDAKTMRSIDFKAGQQPDRAGLIELVRAAIAQNRR